MHRIPCVPKSEVCIPFGASQLIVFHMRRSVYLKSALSFHIPSCPGSLWNSQIFLSSSLNTGVCVEVSLGVKYSRISLVLAWPSTWAWKATKFLRSTKSSSCSVGVACTAADSLSSSSSFSCLWGWLRWFLAFILARREDEEREPDSSCAPSPLKWAADPGFLTTAFFITSVSYKKNNNMSAQQPFIILLGVHGILSPHWHTLHFSAAFAAVPDDWDRSEFFFCPNLLLREKWMLKQPHLLLKLYNITRHIIFYFHSVK